jgi:hypothetical protein
MAPADDLSSYGFATAQQVAYVFLGLRRHMNRGGFSRARPAETHPERAAALEAGDENILGLLAPFRADQAPPRTLR